MVVLCWVELYSQTATPQTVYLQRQQPDFDLSKKKTLNKIHICDIYLRYYVY